jgi:transposase
MTSIGVDVGAKELAVAVRHKGSIQKNAMFKNTPAGHKQISRLCLKYLKYGKVRVAMEATGVYYFDLAVTLTESKKLEVMVINPRATKSFGQALMQRNKTDKIDAQILATYAEKMEYPLWKRPSQHSLSLRYITRAINTLVEDKAAAKNNLHALQSCSEAPSLLLKSTQEKIDFLGKELKNLQDAAMTLIKTDEQLSRKYDLLISIKGFAQASSIQFIGEAITIPAGLTHRQWVAFAGLDPCQYQSGTSINKRPGISKSGNRRLRKALFMPALSASRNDNNVNAYFRHLIDNRGLAKLQAITAIMRKFLHSIHAMFRQGTPFDGVKFYVIK